MSRATAASHDAGGRTRAPKRLLRWGAGVAAVGALAGTMVGFAPGAPAPQLVTVQEGTNIALTASPDGQRLIFDLQGALWSLPRTGGMAKRISEPFLEPARPDYAPQGELIAFQAYAGGTFHIWTSRPDGTDLKQRTSGHGDDREPSFSPDGKRIAFASDRAFEGSYDIWVLELANGALTRWTSASTDEFEPAWLPSGELAYVVGTGATGTSIQASSALGSARTLITAPTGTRLNAPSPAPDGERIAYLQFASNRSQLFVSGTRVGASDDVFPFPAHWLSNNELLYSADGELQHTTLDTNTQAQIPFSAEFILTRLPYLPKRRDFDSHLPRQAKGIVRPSLSPDGKQVLFQALNQLWLAPIGGKPRALTSDSYYKADPAFSPDGTRVVYASDKAGTQDLYVLTLASGAEQRVSSLPGAEVSPAWSPDGRQLAFQDQTGATHTLELASGTVKPLVGALFAPGKPSWHASGKTIALAALKPYTQRFREGTSQILTADVASLALRYSQPAPYKSISTRGEDGPVYAPDGSALAYVVESVLWVHAVDAQGVPTGEGHAINDEVTDAPSWSGDSKQLLYLSNGKLRIIARDGGKPRDVPLDLRWTPQHNQDRVIVHAGTLWDGRGPDVQHDVDVVLQGHRIERVRPHRPPVAGERVIDASTKTVIPGLWESHTHQWISGKFYGDRLGRLWLAYGVTTLNSVGDPAYRAVETKEAFASGARVGPRYFPTGEAIDGERVYYNFMRPTTGGDPQLIRELARAKALEYDNLKTYVRLSHAEQAKVLAFAHRILGVPAESHYLLPGIALGVDGQTHVSATTRTGFSYTRSYGAVSYGDVRALFRASGAFVISTTFSPALYAEEPGLVEDPRLTVLNTPWDQALLRTKRDTAVNTDQSVPLDSLRKEEDTVKNILDGGVVLAGTDSPIDNVATALHLNLRAQVEVGGLPNWRALQTATKLPAEAFGVGNDLGTIEPGKLADLALIDGDPLQEIDDLVHVSAVLRDGTLFTVEELLRAFDGSAPAPPAAKVKPSALWWHNPDKIGDDHH